MVNEQLEIFVCYYNFNDENYKILPIKEFMDKNWEKFNKANAAMLIGG
jgi:predicted secreted acid phosphatase